MDKDLLKLLKALGLDIDKKLKEIKDSTKKKPTKHNYLLDFMTKRDKDNYIEKIMGQVMDDYVRREISGSRIQGMTMKEIKEKNRTSSIFPYVNSSINILNAKVEILLFQQEQILKYIDEYIGMQEVGKQADDILKEKGDKDESDK